MFKNMHRMIDSVYEILRFAQNDREDFPFFEAYQSAFRCHPDDISPKDLFFKFYKNYQFLPDAYPLGLNFEIYYHEKLTFLLFNI